MERHHIHDLAAAYALDALDAEERRAFDAHLAGCERCREEVALLADTAAALAYGTEGPAPAPALRERILVAARGEGSTVVPLRRRLNLPAAAALAAAAAALALGISAAGDSGNFGAISVLADPAGRRVALENAQGALAVDRSGSAALALSALRGAPAGKTYEAWVISGGKPAPAGLFGGGRKVVVRLDRRVPEGATVAVTIEEDGGTEAPTGRPLFSASV